MKKEKKFNLLVIVFMLVQPLLDVITSIQINNNINAISISLIIRGLFFLIVLYYLLKNKERKFLFLFLVYFLLAISYQLAFTKNNFIVEISNIIQIFYLPILILFFNKYNNKNISDKFVLILYFIYLNLILVPYLFGIGYDITSRYVNKKGFFGLFYFGNEISGILIGLLPIVLNYVIKANNYILKFVFYLELLLVIYLVGTKTMFLGTIITIIFLYIRYLKQNYLFMSDKKRYIMYFLPIIFILLVVLIFPKTIMYSNLKTTLKYYKIDSLKEATTIKNIDNILYSNRLDKVGEINNKFVSSKYQTVMYGLGKTVLLSVGTLEIDILDIFFSIGIFGTIIYFLLFSKAYRNNSLRDIYDFSFILFLIMSLFSGHILIKTNVSIYIALLFLLSKNSIKIDKKRILLVSNMYPSKKYKYYGSFVKNTKEFLEKNDFEIDLVVIQKQDTFIKKLYAYFKFYFMSIIKGIFNNYDYIYVHFISHSSLGAVFTKIFSKDTKLVLNAHGNDVVNDLESEIKNVNKSKNYIKYADKVVVPSNYFKDVMMKEYGVKEEDIYVYPSGGVDTKLFKNIDMNQAKKKCKLKEEYNYIGYISRIEKNKGFDVFIKAINELKEENKIDNKRFLIVGTGSLEEEMNNLIKKYDLIDYIELRSMVSQEELVNLYNSLDIFVFPTYRKSESLGLVGLEAMACETFVIGSDNYGVKDYLKNNKNGFAFEPKNYKDLKNKILDYYELNNEQLIKFRKKERETALKYDINANKDKILEVFK